MAKRGDYMEHLTRIREEKGLTQKELGRLVGVAEATISNYENGKRDPKLDKLVALADALNVSLDELVRGKEKDRHEGRSISDLITRLDGYNLQQLREVVAFAQYLQYRKERELTEGQGKEDK